MNSRFGRLKPRWLWGIRIATAWAVVLLMYYIGFHRNVHDTSFPSDPSDPTPSLAVQHTSLHHLEGVQVRPNLLVWPPKLNSYVAVCTIAKDERDMREWVHYHYWAGIDKFYVYDHNSSVPLWRELEDWIRLGVVEYVMFAGHHRVEEPKEFSRTAQGYVYQNCLARTRGRHVWLAFIDPDEYIVLYQHPQQQPNIGAFLKEYEGFGGLGMNWMVFGSAGHRGRPDGGVLANYVKCLPMAHQQNTHVKSIVNLKRVADIGTNPHQLHYVEGYHAVNEGGREIPGAFSDPPSHTRIALHHYVLKSLEDFNGKIDRGGGSGGEKTLSYFESIDAQAVNECTRGAELAALCCSKEPAPGSVAEEPQQGDDVPDEDENADDGEEGNADDGQ